METPRPSRWALPLPPLWDQERTGQARRVCLCVGHRPGRRHVCPPTSIERRPNDDGVAEPQPSIGSGASLSITVTVANPMTSPRASCISQGVNNSLPSTPKHRSVRVTFVACALLMAGGIAACGSVPTPESPAEVTNAHVQAIQAGDLRRAERLIAPSTRAQSPHLASADELSGQAQPRETKRTASWRSPVGGRLTLTRGAAGWRITEGVLNLRQAETPEKALRLLARAILDRDLRGLAALAPTEESSLTSEDVRAVFGDAALAKALTTLATRLDSQQYRLSWSGSSDVRASSGESVVVLRLQDARWRVVDLEPASVYSLATD